MTTFREIEVVAVPASEREPYLCNGCVVYENTLARERSPATTCKCKSHTILQPASLHDGRPRVVLTGGRKPSFPIKAVWYRDGLVMGSDGWGAGWKQFGSSNDILAVERADEGEEK